MRLVLLMLSLFISQFVVAQNLSKDAVNLSHSFNDYMASGDMVDSKDNIKAMKKSISKIQKSQDTTAIAILLDVYLKYDALETDIKELSYVALLGFKNQALPKVIVKLNEAEQKYGIQKNMHTDYMDLVALKKKLMQ